jgi:hypothetical protein
MAGAPIAATATSPATAAKTRFIYFSFGFN